VDAAKPNLGLTNWRGALILKQDVAIAKNYLTEPELAALNNLVEQYLIFAEARPCGACRCTWGTGSKGLMRF
jgi:hypothetical protein